MPGRVRARARVGVPTSTCRAEVYSRRWAERVKELARVQGAFRRFLVLEIDIGGLLGRGADLLGELLQPSGRIFFTAQPVIDKSRRGNDRSGELVSAFGDAEA